MSQSPYAIAVRERGRSEEHTSELQSHSFISYAVFCLKKKNKKAIAFRARTCITVPSATIAQHARRDHLLRADGGKHCLVVFFEHFFFLFFFFNDTATTEIYPLPLHAALPIYSAAAAPARGDAAAGPAGFLARRAAVELDRKSTRLNSSHIPLSRMPSSA